MMAKNHKTMLSSIIIGAVFLLTQVNFSIYLPTMPALAQLYGVTSHQIMSSISYGFFGYLLGQLFWGTASDYFGRKRMLLLALLLYSISLAWLIFSTFIVEFFILYSIMGFAIAACTSIGNAFMHDIYGASKVKIALSYVGITLASGPFVFPFVGTYLLTWFNWKAPFLFLLIASTLIFLALAIYIKEPKKNAPTNTANASNVSLIQRFSNVLTHQPFLAYVLALSCSFGLFYSYMTVSSYLFIKYFHLSTKNFGAINALVVMGYFLGAITFSILVKRAHLRHLVMAALFISLISSAILLILCLTHTSSLFSIIVVMMMFIFGLGISVPACKSGCMSSHSHYPGVSASCMKLIQSGGALILSAVAAYVGVSFSLIPLSILLFSGSVISTALFFFILPSHST